MHRHGYTADDVFVALRRRSQHTNRKLGDVAADLLTAHANGTFEQQFAHYGLT
jgi:AmiR/NasT family two-component response regulator